MVQAFSKGDERQVTHHSLAHQAWAGRRTLVTGGTGFLGAHLVRRLVDLGARVTVALEEGGRPSLPEAVDLQPGDVRDAAGVRRLLEAARPDLLFHLAAVGVNAPFIDAVTALEVNLGGTINLLRAVDGCVGAVQRVVVAGTSYEYGEHGQLDPGNVYAASKVAAWAFCRMHYRAYGTPVVVARPFNVYGPGQNPRALIPAAIQAALSGQDFDTTPGEQRRDFVYVDDVIQGLLQVALADGITGQALDLGTGRATPVRDVVKKVFALTESRAQGPTTVQGRPRIGALPYRPGVVWELAADAARTTRLTGWQASTGLEQGLQLTIAAFSDVYHKDAKTQ